MKLIARFERRSHDNSDGISRSTHTGCFVSLPSPVAASLWNLKPHASLIILSLQRKQTSHSEDGERTEYVAWTGNTISHPDALGINPLFASSLGLREGEVVEVLVSARIVGNTSTVKVLSATLRPLSYQEVDTGPQQVPNANDVAGRRSLAREQYNCLSETADILERTILPQIRVLYRGLRFPVSLPGKDFICVEVTQLELATDSAVDKYGVLVPGTELLIEPPPPDPEDQENEMKVNEKFRVISFSDALRSFPHSLLLTQAILPQSFSTSVDIRAARVSRRPLRDGQLLLPLTFKCHSGIPDKHVWLPSFIWRDLKLAPLDPVFIEEVPMFSNAPDSVRIASTYYADPIFPSYENVRQAGGVIYQGMRLRNGKLTMANSRETIPQQNSLSSKGTSGDEENRVTDIMADWEGTHRWRNHLDDADRRLRSKVNVVVGWKICESQNMTVSEEDDGSDDPGTSGIQESTSFFNPMVDDTLRMRLAEGLTRRSRTVVHEAIRWASRALCGKVGSTKSSDSSILLIQGPEGSGKTLVCKTIAAILRSVGRLRTIWIQCLEKKEKFKGMMRRVREAYDSAADGGPGVVVFDDVDFWIGARRPEKADTSDERNKGTGELDYDNELLRRMKMTRSHSVLTVITCRDATGLDDCFRAPGAIGPRFALELPGREDMSVLRWAASQDTNVLVSTDIGASHPDFELAMEGATPPLEGYNAKEVQLLFSRAFNQIDPESEMPQEQQAMKHLEKMISEMAPGGMKKGPRSQKKNEAGWTWNRIGGAGTAKQALTEVLLWQSRRHGLFERSPIPLPRGILLYGPPGCGKTMLAKAAANESKMRCIIMKGPELMSKYIGESEAEVRRAFARASRLRPCVLLFDEFDSLAPRRGSGTGVTDRIVNTLLTCMDGAERLSEGVYLLATSSRPELIDPAVLRPGRLDRWVPVEVPASAGERLDILKRLSEDFFHSSDALDSALRNVADGTEDYTGADLGAILNDARIKIRKMGQGKKVSDGDLVEVIGEALRESHPSMSHAERARFKEVMEAFGRKPGKGGKGIPSTQRVALK